MPSTERNIIFTNDLDGIHFRTFPPFKTTLRLLRRNLELPDVNPPVGEYNLPEGWRGVFFSKWSIFIHKISPVNRDALESLEIFKQAAGQNDRQLKFAALSGRETYKHAMTKQRLAQSGHMEYFTDLYLNQGRSSSAWKESAVRTLTKQGLNVVHIDDDLRAGLMVARVNNEYPGEDRVLVYVMRNISNHSRLLRRAQVEIPNNLLFVHSFKEAATDFAQRIADRKL